MSRFYTDWTIKSDRLLVSEHSISCLTDVYPGQQTFSPASADHGSIDWRKLWVSYRVVRTPQCSTVKLRFPALTEERRHDKFAPT